VLDARGLAGRTLFELIVGCDEPLRAVGAVCMETSPRAPLDYLSANNQCTQRGGRLPLYTELVDIASAITSQEWTSDVVAESGGTLTTLVYGEAGVGSVPHSPGHRPYRCALPVSNAK
jgi:hypothetical protein